MKILGRIVIRPAADGVSGDLILGALFKDQKESQFEPNTIYEIQDWDGEIGFKPVGKAAIGDTREKSAIGVCWGNSIDHILDIGGGKHLLTIEEAEQIKADSRNAG